MSPNRCSPCLRSKDFSKEGNIAFFTMFPVGQQLLTHESAFNQGLRSGPWHPDSEDSPETRTGTLCPDRTAMEFDECAYDRQSQTETAVAAASFGLPQGFKEMRQAVGGDAFAGICDRQSKVVGIVFQTYPNASAPRRELQRVGNEIPDDLLKSF